VEACGKSNPALLTRAAPIGNRDRREWLFQTTPSTPARVAPDSISGTCPLFALAPGVAQRPAIVVSVFFIR